jgi:hypothetical protein
MERKLATDAIFDNRMQSARAVRISVQYGRADKVEEGWGQAGRRMPKEPAFWVVSFETQYFTSIDNVVMLPLPSMD